MASKDATETQSNFTSKMVHFGGQIDTQKIKPKRAKGDSQGQGTGGKRKTVVVCFFHQAYLCSVEIRNDMIKQRDRGRESREGEGMGISEEEGMKEGGNTKEGNQSVYTLLLIGGTWNEWLRMASTIPSSSSHSYHSPLVEYDLLPSTIHVASGRVGRAVEVIATADDLLVIHRGSNTERYINQHTNHQCILSMHYVKTTYPHNLTNLFNQSSNILLSY